MANRFAVSPRQDSIIVESGVIATESTLTCVEGWVERVVSGDGGRLVEGIRLSIVRWLNAVAIVGILADDNDDVRFGSALFVKQLVGLRDGFYGSTRGFAVGDIVPLVLVDVYGTSVVRAGGRIGNLVVRRKNRLHGEVRLVSETRDIQRASLADALPFSRIALIPRVGKIAFRKTPALPAFYACVKTDHLSLIVLNPVNGYRYSAQGRYGARYHFATVYRTVGERHHALGSRKANVRTWLFNNVGAPNRVFQRTVRLSVVKPEESFNKVVIAIVRLTERDPGGSHIEHEHLAVVFGRRTPFCLSTVFKCGAGRFVGGVIVVGAFTRVSPYVRTILVVHEFLCRTAGQRTTAG